jgi:hypothetical protein
MDLHLIQQSRKRGLISAHIAPVGLRDIAGREISLKSLELKKPRRMPAGLFHPSWVAASELALGAVWIAENFRAIVRLHRRALLRRQRGEETAIAA